MPIMVTLPTARQAEPPNFDFWLWLLLAVPILAVMFLVTVPAHGQSEPIEIALSPM